MSFLLTYASAGSTIRPADLPLGNEHLTSLKGILQMKLNTWILLVAECAIVLSAAISKAQPPAIDCPTTLDGIGDCPNTGCGPDADIELNKSKNRTDIPNESDVKKKTLDAVRSIAQPTRWDTGQDRTPLRQPGKEGTPVQVRGFISIVKPGSAESCNCGLTHRVDNDVHLVLVDDVDQAEETSVTAELTPRVRATGHTTNWLYKNAKDLEGEYVRVTGYLMLDTKHIRQSHRLSGERLNQSLKRSTNWEVHPVVKLEVCRKSLTACNADQGWEEF